ncbi:MULTISPECIES: MarR family winged helix-turn-helix transcriptional regulator [unclassified Undibacterium]|nr:MULTISPECIES: MarR family transcriptional regulator [unclassified Undibacterium]MEB0217064.1 MarR family transcriptional regulator [Undibacterium sp. 5I2]MEB0140905.1 MarR family transcriptional regulator [Undibacterium sp. CCC2.1]MEB0173881.1 MarR family transcriptional regulator [Undibacterium sp. CCC1.1]MEB0176600.1 MarR family transcriptional regulator [Undibacterium sp. CCC3.4]WPX44578.1 MarR family transcriptional regulator [Undibacterium sp. CCC3.4]
MPIHTEKAATRAPRQAAKTAENTENTLPATRVLRQFRVVVNAVKVHFRQVEKSTGIGGAQVWALSVIQTQPEISVNQLAQAMDIHQSTASNMVKTLIQQELIAAKKHATDRRSVRLTILAKGRKVLKTAPTPFSGVLPDALSGLDTRTLQRLEKDLATLITALHADERAANTPLADL